jgi:MFS family permease
MRDVVLANTVYWIGLSGTSLTLLPLFMVGPDLHLTATQIGLCFAFQSSVSVAASQPVAYLADKWGKEKCIALGLGVLGGSMIGLPVAATSFESLLLMLAPIALGSTCLSAVPAALVGDIVEPSQRSQALALLRTAGDVGLLVGAIFSGMVSSASSLGLTMEVNGALLLASGAVWGARRFGVTNTK